MVIQNTLLFGIGYRLGLGLRLEGGGGGSAVHRIGGCVNRHLFNSNNFAVISCLGGGCALPSAVLIISLVHYSHIVI